MKRMLYALIVMVGMGGVSYGMQKGVASSHIRHENEKNLPFSFIGQSPILKSSSSDSSVNLGWQKVARLKEEELDEYLMSTDLSDSELERLELINSTMSMIKALEQAFFGNTTLYGWFCEIKDKIIQGDELSYSQKNCLNWLIQNRRGDYECAKVLVTFYGLIEKQAVMSSFWRGVALFLNLPVGSPR